MTPNPRNAGRHDKASDDGASPEFATEGHSRIDARGLWSRLVERQRSTVPAWDEDWDELSIDQRVERLYSRKLRTERIGHRDRIQQLLLFLVVVVVVFFGLRGYGNQARFAEDLAADVARDRVTGEVRACESRNDFRLEVREVFGVLISDDDADVPPITESPQFLALDETERDFVLELARLAGESSALRREALEGRLDKYKERFPIEDCTVIERRLEARYGLSGTGGR